MAAAVCHPLVERARALAPSLTAFRAAHDRDRRLAPEVVAHLREGGLLGALVPRELGGHELPLPVYVELLVEIASGDSATAWCLMTASTSTLLAAYLPRATAEALWRGPAPLLAGVFAPGGALVADADGVLRLRGRWPYASGCRHADVFALGAMAQGRHVVCFVPAAAVRALDNWDALGLAGTGSHDVELDAVIVTEDHVTSVTQRSPWAAAALYRVPMFGLLATGVGACALGIARGALWHAARGLGAAPGSAQLARYAELRAELDAAHAYLAAAATRAQARAEDGDTSEHAITRGELRLAARHVAQRCAEVGRGAFHLGGGASARGANPAAAALRDLETVLTHRMVSERILPAAARALLGIGEVAPEL